MAASDRSLTGEQRRVLIVRIGAMGDVLHAMPAVAALRNTHPDWRIGWAIEPRWSALLASRPEAAARSKEMPLVDRVHLVPTRRWKRQPVSKETLGEIAALRRELRGERYDVCVDLQGAIRSAIVGRMAGAMEYAGPDDPREAAARWIYRMRVKTAAGHVVEQAGEILGEAVGEALRPASVPLPVDDADERWRDELLAGAVPSGRFVMMAPTAGWGAKQWPVERYGAVAEALGKAGYRTLVNATGASDAIANELVRLSGGAAAAVPCSVGQLIALGRRAGVVVAGDTGPLHLAAALQRPVVALFGPTDPARNGPYGTMSRVLRHGPERRDHRRLKEPEAGLLAITVDEVVGATMELLGG